MKKAVNLIFKTVAMALTGFITLVPLFTCIFFVHQPKFPEEINDFRRNDK